MRARVCVHACVRCACDLCIFISTLKQQQQWESVSTVLQTDSENTGVNVRPDTSIGQGFFFSPCLAFMFA